MPITSTNYTDISYVAEVIPGTIPPNDGAAGPTQFQIIPTTGGAPASEITTAVSEVIRSDRQTDDLVVVDSDITGEMNIEVSYAPFKPLLTELLRGDVDDTTVPGTDAVRNGNNQASTFTFCKRVQGITDPAYFYYAGCVISQSVFNFETGSILTGTMSLYGRDETTATETVPYPEFTAGQEFLPAVAYSIMNSVQNVVTTITGLPAGTEYSTLNLTINNNTTPAKAIGTLGAVNTADFTLEVTGDIDLYFQDLSAYNLFIQSGNFKLVAELYDGPSQTGNKLVVTLPFCKFETLDTPIEGKDNFLMLSGALRALRDPDDDYMVEFAFTDAV